MALIGKCALCLGIVAGTASFNFLENDKLPSSTEVKKQSDETDLQKQNVCESTDVCPEEDCGSDCNKSEKIESSICGGVICPDNAQLFIVEKNTAPQ